VTLFFDLDGTLVDSSPGIIGSLKQAVGVVLPELEVANLKFKIGPPVREIMKTALRSVNDQQLSLLESAFRTSYDDNGWKMATPYPGVYETLLSLRQRGIKMYVITNKPSAPTMQMLTHLELVNYFTHILSRDSRKPPFANKSEMITFLIKEYHIKSNSCCVVGDSDEDQDAAKKCKVRFIGIEFGYGTFSKTENNASSVQSFSGLLSLV